MRILAGALLLVVLSAIHILVQNPPPLGQIQAYLAGSVEPEYPMIFFRDAALPRTVMALLVGATLGIAGSLLQQMLRNPLASPTTLGVASGAWCALVAATVFVPALAVQFGFWIALLGGITAALLVLAIVGPRGMSGVPAILAGMAVNLLFGAIAQALVLVENQRVRDLGLWAAGDLQQNGWGEVYSLAPLCFVLGLAAFWLRRPLGLLRLGTEIAGGRGLSLMVYAPMIATISIALTAGAISLVGPIAFIGLLAPNCARLLGARTPVEELAGSLIVGAAALLATDAVAASVSALTRDIVVSGVVAPLLGAPILLLVLLRRRFADHRPEPETVRETTRSLPMLTVILTGIVGTLGWVALVLGRTEAGWTWAALDSITVSFRWPRVLSAALAGAALACAGVILQRLLRNPLASPEIIGISAGAGLAVALATITTGAAIADPRPYAILGALCVLLLILFVLRRGQHSVLAVILTGVAVAATLDAGLAFALSTGGDEVYTLLGWLAGTTIYADETTAFALLLWVFVLIGTALLTARWLDLIALGPVVATGRGLNVTLAQLCLFGIAGVLVAFATAAIGLAPFIGLLAPNLALLLGAGNARSHVVVAALIGCGLLVLSDWVGRMALYPIQIPAGLAAAVIGGFYFIGLLKQRSA